MLFRSPVGSSATMSAGSVTSERAIAVRCSCPPESCRGRCFARSLNRKERRAQVETALALVGLSDRAKHLPRQLSGGQEQRTAIARSLVTDPALIVADEPTGNLDHNSATEVLTILQSLSRQMGKTVIMVTHDPKAAAFGSRTIHLEKGELVKE